MPDENYSVIATGTYQTGQEVGASVGVFSNVPPTTTAARLVFHINTGLPVDNAYANVAIFR
jgi:hypothetical protein